jgi:hypothetical protein
MSRFLSVSVLVGGLVIAPVGCGSSGPTVIEAPTAPETPSVAEQEIKENPEEYEKAMTEAPQ